MLEACACLVEFCPYTARPAVPCAPPTLDVSGVARTDTWDVSGTQRTHRCGGRATPRFLEREVAEAACPPVIVASGWSFASANVADWSFQGFSRRVLTAGVKIQAASRTRRLMSKESMRRWMLNSAAPWRRCGPRVEVKRRWLHQKQFLARGSMSVGSW